jgi:hypothetical protein
MIPDKRRWTGIRRADSRHLDASMRRSRSAAPVLECLESRRLLSLYTGASANLPVGSTAGAFLVQVSGPGVVKAHPAVHGAIDLTAYGTTADTTITITQTKPRYHFTNQLLMIHDLVVRSGQLGGLEALPAELNGRMTPLTNSVNNLDIGALGPKAQVTIEGSLGEMSVSTIDLGPTGHVAITGDLNSFAQSGPMTIGAMTLDGGRFTVGRDSLESIAIGGDLTISQDGELAIGRDQDGTFAVDGSVLLNTGGQLLVGRNLDDLSINGNLIVGPSGSGIAVNGALNGLTIDGYFQGQGGTRAPSAIDLGVGLNLTSLTILGGVSGQGGLINANIRAGGTVSGVGIAYGTYQSTIQANSSMPT